MNCGAEGAITGIGNVLPNEVLTLLSLCSLAKSGDPKARHYALELDNALHVLSTFDEGPDLVLFYKHLLVLKGDSKYSLHFNTSDELTKSQTKYAEEQLQLFDNWWSSWEGKDYKP